LRRSGQADKKTAPLGAPSGERYLFG